MIRLRTLGQCSIQIDTLLVGPDAEVVFATLLVLAVEGGRRVDRSELLALLWPETSASRASHCLRQTIYRLRRLGAPLQSDRTRLALPSNAIDSDIDALLRANRGDDIMMLADRITGPFLPGYAPIFSEPLRDWVEHLRDRVSAGARRVLVAAISARKSRGEWSEVERLAHQCLVIDPLNEEATLALAEAAALGGGKVEAIGILDRYLREMGPTARELRLPAIALRSRISEPEMEFPTGASLRVPFVGRSAEMASLTAALRSARSGTGTVHFIHGEPGIGKTRLVSEFMRVAALEGARVAQVVCQSSDSGRPLSAFVDLVPRFMALPGALGCSPKSNKYLRHLTAYHCSDVPPTPETSEAVLLYANVRESLFDLLDAIAAEGTLIVAIEDVHWLDAASWEIIAEAIPWTRTRRMIVLLTSRHSEVRYRSNLDLAVEELRLIRLGPIDSEACTALAVAAHARHKPPITEAFRTWCVEMSGGNPYYLSELVLHGLGTRGEFAVPLSLKTLVAQRVAHLRPISSRVLQVCAILGRNATLERLEAVLDKPRVNLLDALDDLEARGLIDSNDTNILCRHQLLAEAAISRLSKVCRSLLHQCAASALEQTLADEVSPAVAWSCAEHWSRAGNLERAVRLVRRCARQSIEVGRPKEAIELLTRAKTLPLSPDALIEVTSELIYAHRSRDCWHDASAEFEDLRRLRRARDPKSSFHDDVELVGIEAEWLGGVDTKKSIQQILECCGSPTATPNHRVAAARIGLIIASNLGDANTGRLIRNLVARDLGNEDIEVADRIACQLIFETSFGDESVAHQVLDELLSMAVNVPPRQRAILLVYAAHACERLGLTSRVCEIATAAFQISEASSYGTAACSAARKLAWFYVETGDEALATHWYNVAKSWEVRGQFSSFRGDIYGLEAEILIAKGDFAAAEAALEKSRQAYGCTIHTRWRLYVLASQCAIWLATDMRHRCAAAVEEFRELFSLVGYQGGNDTIVARYVRLLRAAGHNEDAGEALNQYLARRGRPSSPYGPELASVVCALNTQTAPTSVAC